MKYYIVALILAKTFINGNEFLVLIINENKNESSGFRKVISPTHPYCKFILEWFIAENKDWDKKTDAYWSTKLQNPICFPEMAIDLVKLPNIKFLSGDVETFEYNNAVSFLLDRGIKEHAWEEAFLEEFNLEAYSLKLGGNFPHCSLEYNENIILKCLQEMRNSLDTKVRRYTHGPLAKLLNYKMEITDRYVNGNLSLLYFPDIDAGLKIDCDRIEGFNWGISIVVNNHLKGLIDLSGDFLLPCEYKDILPLKLFYINKTNQVELSVTDDIPKSPLVIHTFVQNKDGKWAYLTINRIRDRYWEVMELNFRFQELHCVDQEDCLVGIINQDESIDDAKEVAGIPNKSRNHIVITTYTGDFIPFNIRVDRITNISYGNYIIVQKGTDYNVMTGLYKIEKNKKMGTFNLSVVLRIKYGSIKEAGSNLFMVGKYWDDIPREISIDMEYDYMFRCKNQELLNSLIECHEFMKLFHIRHGFIKCPICPTRHRIIELDEHPVATFCADKYILYDECVKMEWGTLWYYYDELTRTWNVTTGKLVR